MYCTAVFVVEGFNEVVLAAAGADVVLASTCILTGACEKLLSVALVVVVVVGVVRVDTEVKVPALDVIEVKEDETEVDEGEGLRNEADGVVAEVALMLVGEDDVPALRLLSGTELTVELLVVLMEFGDVGDGVETVLLNEVPELRV